MTIFIPNFDVNVLSNLINIDACEPVDTIGPVPCVDTEGDLEVDILLPVVSDLEASPVIAPVATLVASTDLAGTEGTSVIIEGTEGTEGPIITEVNTGDYDPDPLTSLTPAPTSDRAIMHPLTTYDAGSLSPLTNPGGSKTRQLIINSPFFSNVLSVGKAYTGSYSLLPRYSNLYPLLHQGVDVDALLFSGSGLHSIRPLIDHLTTLMQSSPIELI